MRRNVEKRRYDVRRYDVVRSTFCNLPLYHSEEIISVHAANHSTIVCELWRKKSFKDDSFSSSTSSLPIRSSS